MIKKNKFTIKLLVIFTHNIYPNEKSRGNDGKENLTEMI